ncbi:hypothetical protein ACQEU3_43335 [Spirillospora sp. CA-253888]
MVTGAPRRLPPPLWAQRAITVTAVLAVLSVLATVVLVAVGGTSGGGGAGRTSGGGGGEAFTVSYDAAAARLDGMSPGETREQIRDWTRTALAARLRMNTGRYRDAGYDLLPVRDEGLADLAVQPTGPGRALFDVADGRLHLLVDTGAPHRQRTLGLLLDQHRTDHGSDPRSVRVHRFTVDPATSTVQVRGEPPMTTARFRAANGHRALRVDRPEGLRDFLARTSHLSRLEVRGDQIWADGWKWPGDAAPPLTPADVATLQRGYADPSAHPPGFSLDPARPRTADELRAALPGLDRRVAAAVVAGNWGALGFSSAAELRAEIHKRLFAGDALSPRLRRLGFPGDRTRLYALAQMADDDGWAYNRARYEGGLAGTEVGMTLFYTDLVAKEWVMGTGSGVPDKAVPGFVPDPRAEIPPGMCGAGPRTESERGRLWFGQNETGFAFHDDRVDLGARATRLFLRSKAADGRETAPSAAFGRGLRWWDRHFQDVADHEPQYARLEQLMRWSGALEWLADASRRIDLPEAGDARIRSDLKFQDWYRDHRELRERAPIAFVKPAASKAETLLTRPSRPFKRCGDRFVTGGVSLADLIRRRADEQQMPEQVPPSLRRAGPVIPEKTTVSPDGGTGTITRRSPDEPEAVPRPLERRFTTKGNESTAVQTTGPTRPDTAFGQMPVVDSPTTRFAVETRAGGGVITESLQFQGTAWGRLETTLSGSDRVVLRWVGLAMERVRLALTTLQRDAAPTSGALYRHPDRSGRPVYRVGEPDDPVLTITDADQTGPGLRLGLPGRSGTGSPTTAEARLVKPPDSRPGAPRGPPGGWWEFRKGSGGGPPRVVTGTPHHDATPSTVRFADGRTIRVLRNGDTLWVPGADAKRTGSVEFAAFVRTGVLPKQTGDGYLRGLLTDRGATDTVALVGDAEVMIAGPGHAWGDRVRQAIGADTRPETVPLVTVEGGHVLHHSPARFTAEGSPWETAMRDVGAQAAGRPVLVQEKLAGLVLNNGVFPVAPLSHDRRVRVVEATVQTRPPTDSPVPADVLVRSDAGGNERWIRVTGPGRRSGSPSSATPPPAMPSPPLSSTPGGQGSGMRVLLVCSADSDTNCSSDLFGKAP